ncbi:hypothetical protein IAT40_004408 [Kwoniella sp. CBS 6097]
MSAERIILLDGGMGTTLESRGYDVSTALWGSDLLVTDPKAIQDVYKGYLEAGSDLIQTATYPLTPDNVAAFLANGSDECHLGRAWSVIHRSVKIVSDLIEDDDHYPDSVRSRQSTQKIELEEASFTDCPKECRRRRRGIVLSCGPFGATLKPGQEYAGIYPKPYGPGDNTNCFPAGSASSHHESVRSGSGTNADIGVGVRGEPDAEVMAVEELTEWYLDKLRVFAFAPSPSVYPTTHANTNTHGQGDGRGSRARDEAEAESGSSAWRDIEWIAFETIPLLYEIKAIRRAMSILRAELERRHGDTHSESDAVESNPGEEHEEGQTEMEKREQGIKWWDKKFWITSAYPNGQHPQLVVATDPNTASTNTSINIGGNTHSQAQVEAHAHASIPHVIEALLGSSENNSDDGAELARPDGLGINCTHPQYLPRLASGFTEAYRDIQLSLSRKSGKPTKKDRREEKVRFVVYPDGGQVYDVNTRSWKEDNTPSSAQDWAERIMETVKLVDNATMSTIRNNESPGVDQEKIGNDSGGEEENEKVWGGVIVGGCCKTTSDEIRALRTLIDSDR